MIGIKTTMRDHTISLPAPENTVAFDIPNACTECHADAEGGVGGRDDREMVAAGPAGEARRATAGLTAARAGPPR